MTKVVLPPIDVPVIDLSTGRMTIDWYDKLKAVEGIRLVDLADVPASAPTTTGQRPTFDNTTKKFTWS